MVVRADKLQTSTYNGTDEFVVLGRAWIENTVTASAFSGSLISNDSMVVFDDATGNINGNQITANGNAILHGDGTGADSALQLDGYNPRGGAGYHDFMRVTSTYGSIVNPNKYFRLDQFGSLQILNSTYGSTLFNLTDDGHTIVKGYVQFGSFTAAERTALTASNGMVIYNTTANRFQGYQNGAWINLDDGTAAP